jgi:NADH-quinone oxidoreductase subunit B
MLHEKIRGESLAYSSLREETGERTGRANLPASTIDSVALPFGNSTQQNRASGLVTTSSVARPDDRRP